MSPTNQGYYSAESWACRLLDELTIASPEACARRAGGTLRGVAPLPALFALPIPFCYTFGPGNGFRPRRSVPVAGFDRETPVPAEEWKASKGPVEQPTIIVGHLAPDLDCLTAIW